jgi:hypothetical protein
MDSKTQKSSDLARRKAVSWNFYDRTQSLLTRETHTPSAPAPAIVYFLLGRLAAQTRQRTGETDPVLELGSQSRKTSSLAAARQGGADPDQKTSIVL